MSDTPETLAAILAEMRDFCSGWSEDVDVTVKVGRIYGWMCRIEAASERERTAHTNDIHDALYKATGIPGNSAALREALTAFVDYLTQRRIDEVWAKTTLPEPGLDRLVEQARAALAAPARNADRPECKTLPDAIRFGHFECGHREWWVATMTSANWHDFADWLFAPAKGGDHA